MSNTIKVLPDFIATKQIDGTASVSSVRCLDGLGLNLSLGSNLAVAKVVSIPASDSISQTPDGLKTPLSGDTFSVYCLFYSVKNTGQTDLELTISGGNYINTSNAIPLNPGAVFFFGCSQTDAPTLTIQNNDPELYGECTISFAY